MLNSTVQISDRKIIAFPFICACEYYLISLSKYSVYYYIMASTIEPMYECTKDFKHVKLGRFKCGFPSTADKQKQGRLSWSSWFYNPPA